MTPPIAGPALSQLSEVTVMTVWPSVSSLGIGRLFGRLYACDYGFRLFGVPLTVGRLLALATSPLMAAVYFLMRLPRFPLVIIGIKNPWSWHYRLTNRRVVVENPFGGGELKSIALDRFDAIEVDVQPGQAWYKAGDLVFRHGQVERFRLWGVPRPDTFRQTCEKARRSYVGVQHARELGVAV